MFNNNIMLNTQFQKNISNSNDLKLEIDNLKKEIDKMNNNTNEKITSLKEDLEISLKNNDLNNLEIRKLRLYNFMFKIVGGVSLFINLYLYKKNSTFNIN